MCICMHSIETTVYYNRQQHRQMCFFPSYIRFKFVGGNELCVKWFQAKFLLPCEKIRLRSRTEGTSRLNGMVLFHVAIATFAISSSGFLLMLFRKHIMTLWISPPITMNALS